MARARKQGDTTRFGVVAPGGVTIPKLGHFPKGSVVEVDPSTCRYVEALIDMCDSGLCELTEAAPERAPDLLAMPVHNQVKPPGVPEPEPEPEGPETE